MPGKEIVDARLQRDEVIRMHRNESIEKPRLRKESEGHCYHADPESMSMLKAMVPAQRATRATHSSGTL